MRVFWHLSLAFCGWIWSFQDLRCVSFMLAVGWNQAAHWHGQAEWGKWFQIKSWWLSLPHTSKGLGEKKALWAFPLYLAKTICEYPLGLKYLKSAYKVFSKRKVLLCLILQITWHYFSGPTDWCVELTCSKSTNDKPQIKGGVFS